MKNPLTNSKYHKHLVKQWHEAAQTYFYHKDRGFEFCPEGRAAYCEYLRLEALLNGF